VILIQRLTQPPIQWVPGGSFPVGKEAGAWNWPLAFKEYLKLYLHSPIRLHCVILS